MGYYMMIHLSLICRCVCLYVYNQLSEEKMILRSLIKEEWTSHGKKCGGSQGCTPAKLHVGSTIQFCTRSLPLFFLFFEKHTKPCTSLVSLRLLATPFVQTRQTPASFLVLLQSLLPSRVSCFSILYLFCCFFTTQPPLTLFISSLLRHWGHQHWSDSVCSTTLYQHLNDF